MADFGFPGAFESCIKLSRLHHLDDSKATGTVHYKPSLEQSSVSALKISPAVLPDDFLFQVDEITSTPTKSVQPSNSENRNSKHELFAERKLKKKLHKNKNSPSPRDSNVYIETLHEVSAEPRSTKFLNLILEERKSRWSKTSSSGSVTPYQNSEPNYNRLPKLNKGMHGIPNKQFSVLLTNNQRSYRSGENSAFLLHSAMLSERTRTAHSAPVSQLSHQSNISAKDLIMKSGHALDLPERLTAY